MSASGKPIYLNTAATSHPKPQEVLSYVREALERPYLSAGRGNGAGTDEDVLGSCREQLARLFHVDNPVMLSFTSGATFSLNMAIAGLGLRGRHVVTTSIEHNSTLRPLKRLERTDGVDLTVVKCDEHGQVDVKSIEKAIRSDTAALFVNHASNVVGSVTDVARIGELTSSLGITLVVDASQSAGCVPIDVQQMRIDVLIFTGHKFLFGLEGSGGLYIREGLQMEPLLLGGTGVKSGSLYQTEERPACYEAGTQNHLGIAALNCGVSYVLRNGIERLTRRRGELFALLVSGLSMRPRVTVYGDHRYHTPIISFNISGISPTIVGQMLWDEYRIHVRSGLLCAPLIHDCIGTSPDGVVRLSFSEFTTTEDINYFFQALDTILDRTRRQSATYKTTISSCC